MPRIQEIGKFTQHYHQTSLAYSQRSYRKLTCLLSLDDSLDELASLPGGLNTNSNEEASKSGPPRLELDAGVLAQGTSRGRALSVSKLKGDLGSPLSEIKRKRVGRDVDDDGEVDDLDFDGPSFQVLEATVNARPQKRMRMTAVEMPGLPQLCFPKSLYYGWERPLPPSKEREVLKEFLDEQAREGPPIMPGGTTKRDDNSDDEFTEFILTDFSVYTQGVDQYDIKSKKLELVPLHALKARPGVSECFFDGILSNGKVKRYVERIPIERLSIGNYENVTSHSVGDQIWIASKFSFSIQPTVWYQLAKPASEYARYHTEFLWVANFGKHFIDYLSTHEKITLNNFRQSFHQWLISLHAHDSCFLEWLAQYGDHDFRRVITAYPEFLWNQATEEDQLEFYLRNRKQQIWAEVDPKSLAMVKEEIARERKTVVTPFVFNVFKNMEWAHCMNSRSVSLGVAGHGQHALECNTDFLASSRTSSEDELASQRSDAPGSAPNQRRLSRRGIEERKDMPICVGDVVALKPDALTKWNSVADLWFAYVQSVKKTSKGAQILGLIWLYSPSDTTCANGLYPHSRELFLSDNCNCGDKPAYSSEVVSKISVSFRGDPEDSGADYFVRQKYRSVSGQEAFVTLSQSQSDFKCWHQCAKSKSGLQLIKEKYTLGDTILVPAEYSGISILEPVEIAGFKKNGPREFAQVRRLIRRRRDLGHEGASSNELVYTDDLYEINIDHLLDEDGCRRCHIRFYSASDLQECRIPPPYSRDGTADAYYIIYRHVGNSLEPILNPSGLSLKQGFDPLSSPVRPPLRGLDLYCGGGNFGRGLEESGAIQNRWAVDWAKFAMHTYRANLRDPEATELYYGSVNDYLAEAMQGTTARNVAKRGEVDFISAGSPCQGFSHANQNKKSAESLQNSSMVASVAAFVDFYRPKYALLENVTAMASKGKNSGEVTVFSQLICCLVAMGYQVQQFNIDAWSFGSAQSRRRLFISIAERGLELPPYPGLSHSHPPTIRNARLGIAANGLGFGERRNMPTPFDYISAGEVTKDLPLIGDAKVQSCITHPDHRTSRVENTLTRTQISLIPRNPRGQTFISACQMGRMSKRQIAEYTWKSRSRTRPGSRSWGRINPDGLMPTITTSVTPACAFTGRCVHWGEHRLLTVMEARRAQGFPDQEVLVGSPAEQWKIVGNSVARTVALALGMSIRSAWMSNPPDNPESNVATINLGANKNVARKTTHEAMFLHNSPVKMNLSVTVNLEKEAFDFVTKDQIEGPATPRNLERIGEEHYRNTSQDVHNPLNSKMALSPKRLRNNSKAVGTLTSCAKKPGLEGVRGTADTAAGSTGPCTRTSTFSSLRHSSHESPPPQPPTGSTSSPIIVISDDEDELVYLGTSTPSSKVTISSGETSQNPKSESQTSISMDESISDRGSKTTTLARNRPGQNPTRVTYFVIVRMDYYGRSLYLGVDNRRHPSVSIGSPQLYSFVRCSSPIVEVRVERRSHEPI